MKQNPWNFLPFFWDFFLISTATNICVCWGDIHDLLVHTHIWYPRPAVLGNALGTVPPDPHGHRNGSRSRCMFFCHQLPQPLITSQNVQGDACAGGCGECEIILLTARATYPLPSKSLLLDHSTKGQGYINPWARPAMWLVGIIHHQWGFTIIHHHALEVIHPLCLFSVIHNSFMGIHGLDGKGGSILGQDTIAKMAEPLPSQSVCGVKVFDCSSLLLLYCVLGSKITDFNLANLYPNSTLHRPQVLSFNLWAFSILPSSSAAHAFAWIVGILLFW